MINRWQVSCPKCGSENVARPQVRVERFISVSDGKETESTTTYITMPIVVRWVPESDNEAEGMTYLCAVCEYEWETELAD